MAGPEIAIRPWNPDTDLPFLLSTWLRSYKHNSQFASRIRNHVFFKWHHDLLERALSRPTTRVLVATLPDAQDVIVGYFVHEAQDVPVAHWVYVKADFRKFGVAKALIAASALPPNLKGVEFTHASHDWFDFLERRFPEAVYCPYRL